MFTGIVQDLGRVQTVEQRSGDTRLTIEVQQLPLDRMQVGDSICVQGCCITAVALHKNSFQADLSRETLALTTLGELSVGTRVNLEPALRAGDPLGGHLVSGHIDGIARVVSRASDARSLRLSFEVPGGLARYIARKGSVTIDGVSLTVNEVEGARFGVNLIPHTQDMTTLGSLGVGARANLEVDQIARYIERLMGLGL
ncbi:MAG TPA: riboflavin synthase [Steroidobacteraceae bacterium]|nr:riboflavin synthase [Steroidobacteraceae bacterium]